MASKRFDLLIEQGSTFYLTVNAKNPDGTVKALSGYSGRMQIRPLYNSSTIYVDATTSNGLITILGSQGQVTVTIPATTTDSYSWDGGVYDLEVDNNAGDVIRLVSGSVSLSKQVTR